MLGLRHLICEHSRAGHVRSRPLQLLGQTLTEEDIVPEDQARSIRYEFRTDCVCLGQAFRLTLYCV